VSQELRLQFGRYIHVPEVRRQALITDGKPLIPAVWIAMTKGDAAAFLSVRLSPGEFEGTKRPMTVTPPM